MNKLIKSLEKLLKSEVKHGVDARIREFSIFSEKSNDEWFCELCFCLLTANSKAETAINIQKELGAEGFLKNSCSAISICIKNNKHRFHNNKARFIVEARKSKDVKKQLERFVSSTEKREWLVANIKGLGYKEASHFLRNTGHFDVAILDRHILNLLVENGFLEEKPKTLNRKNYLLLESTLQRIADCLKITQAELDLYMWYLKTGRVLK